MTSSSPLIDLSAPIATATIGPVRDAAKAALDAGATHYTDRPGIGPLREAVAVKLARNNRIAVAPDEVLITCGIQEALFLSLQILAGDGDEVIVTGPAPPGDLELVRMVGAAARVAQADDQLRFDVDRVQELITDNTRVILLRSPTASGEVVPYSALERLGGLVVEHNLRVVTIESGDALAAGTVEHHSIGEIDGLAPRTVTINDFWGTGLEAWRVGYLAAQRSLMAGIKGLKQELSICSPAVSQYAALDAMASADSQVAALCERIEARREAVADALERSGLVFTAHEAGTHVFVRPAAGLPVPTAIARAAEAGVRVADGGLAGADGWLRLTLDHDPVTLGAAAQELADVIGQSAKAA